MSIKYKKCNSKIFFTLKQTDIKLKIIHYFAQNERSNCSFIDIYSLSELAINKNFSCILYKSMLYDIRNKKVYCIFQIIQNIMKKLK